MNLFTEKLANNKKLTIFVRLLGCLVIVAWIFGSFFINGIEDYISYDDYYSQNETADRISASTAASIEQHFTAAGNTLSGIDLYLNDSTDSEITLEIADNTGSVIFQTSFNPVDYTADDWCRIPIDIDDLKINEEYSVSLKGSDLSCIMLTSKNTTNPGFFRECFVDGSSTDYTLAIGFQLLYVHMLTGYGLELFVRLFFLVLIAGCLCYAVFQADRLLKVFKSSEKKKGFWYAVYFSVYTTLLFNPLDTIRTEVLEFSRVIGTGLNSGTDVARRTGNFTKWFICFAVIFALFYLLANYLKHIELKGENERAAKLLDNIIIIANVVLCLRCITYFYDEAQTSQAFYYSDFFIMLAILLTAAYIFLNLERKISVDRLEAILVCGWMLALPASVILAYEWTLGRYFMGFQVILSVVLILLVKFIKIDWNKKTAACGINTCAVFLSLLPFCTSFYIEMLTILNRHEIFVTRPRRYYFGAVCMGLLVTAILAAINIVKKKTFDRWKSFSYPALVFGFGCLWKQIAVSSTYNADLYETANSSILISGFLNWGDIPLVEHYGGHMMFGVWEGIIYGILNNDYMGANFSPYIGYRAVVVAVLFYFLVRYIWNKDAAILAALFFPFYNSITYWGLGILIALAAMAYVKKNTYLRAFLFWMALIWCVLYRLDLGFAFAAAGVLSLIIYMIYEKNLRAAKQLAITLGFWVLAGGCLWFGLCLAKDINPVSRLLEFLYINLSNQNWGYSVIGDPSMTEYAVTYLLIPFMCIIMLLVTVFGKKIKENVGSGLWIFILVLGFSYFFNFSRGLVRHSLVEEVFYICWWSTLLFIPLFAAAIKNNRKIFFPVFCGCILIYTFFSSDNNFSEKSIADSAVGKIGEYTETWFSGTVNNTVIERVKLNDKLQKVVDNYKAAVDTLLDEDETFVDLINKTSLYPLLEKEIPVYVSQSPMQLSGEFTQEEFIKQIDDVPVVFMPCDSENKNLSESLDGVPNSYRYYKVFEYVYQNYVPLCTYENEYAVWCLRDRYSEMAEKITQSDKDFQLADYGYDGPYLSSADAADAADDDSEDSTDGDGYTYLPYIHNYELNKLPVIWAEKDKKKSSGNTVLTDLLKENGVFKFDLNTSEYGTDGNYLKVSLDYYGIDKISKADDDEITMATIRIGKMADGDFETEYIYTFTVLEGQHDYIFRVSNDYYWYYGEPDSVVIESDSQLNGVTMQILEGD